jgi:transcriptional regulator with XRE-family HTH domain
VRGTSATTPLGELLARRLREAREAKRWTQQQLADALDGVGVAMDRTTVAKIEKGLRPVRVEELVAIAATLDVAPVHLFLPIDGAGPVSLAPTLKVELARARAWARGQRPLDDANERLYRYQSPAGQLTEAERDRRMLEAIMNGASAREVADEFQVAEAVVRDRVERAAQQLLGDVRPVTEAG